MKTKEVAVALGKSDFHRAMELRDAEFEEYHEAYFATTMGASTSENMVAEDQV